MNKQLKVLYLSAWYPHRYDAMSGLFVRKHAEAVARYLDVCSLYIWADEKIKKTEIVCQKTNGVSEVYVYYSFCKVPIIKQLTKIIGFVLAFYKGYKIVKNTFGKPNITQVNVLTRNGVLAYLLKIRYKIPYIIVEHWSRYLPQNFNYKGFFRKLATKIVVRNAASVLTVSDKLENAMKSFGLQNSNYQHINNVVDDIFFKKQKIVHNGNFRFLHISCFDERPKNVLGILQAVERLSLIRSDFYLTLVGTGKDWQQAVDYANELNINQYVNFVGEKTPNEVCDYFAQNDVLIMFSNYESAPVVISESLATGTPIISTNVGYIPKMVNFDCGILINPKDVNCLVEKMSFVIDNYSNFDSTKIKLSAQQYSYAEVGKRLVDVYSEILRS